MRDDASAAGWLERSYEKAKGGQVAFVDEAYRGFERKNEQPFYIAAAVVVDTRYMEEIRENLAEIAGGTYWHTTEAMQSTDGPARIVKMLQYLVEGNEVCMLSIQRQVTRSDRDLEVARRECLSGLARALDAGNPIASNTMVIEKRQADKDREADSQLLPELIKQGHVDRVFRIHQASPAEDRLLWLPDLLAHAARRDQALRRPELYDLVREYVHSVEPLVKATPTPRSAPAEASPKKADRSVGELLNDTLPRRKSPKIKPAESKTPPNSAPVVHERGTDRDLGMEP